MHFRRSASSSSRSLRFALALDETEMMIDQIVDGQTNVDEAFHGIQPVLVDVFPDLGGVIRHRVHHFAIGLREPDVVLEEIAVAVDMRHDDLLIDEMVALSRYA